MKKYIFSLGLIGLLIIISTAPAMAGGDSGDSGNAAKEMNFGRVPADFANVPVEEAAAEFRELRKIRGHFDGGEWKDEVDRWMGRKHRIMIELSCRLSGVKYKKGTITKLLDPPDQIVRKGDDLFEQIIRQQGIDLLQQGNVPSTVPSYEFLVYYWRGKHDFLFFTCKDSVIIYSGWWYTGE